MEKIWFRTLLIVLLAIGCLSGCKKSTANAEITGPDETIILDLVDRNDRSVGALYVDNMKGRAQARILMDSGYYQPGVNMKANITLSAADGNVLYAHCTDVSGNNGKCSTFPIKVLSNSSDASFEEITKREGIVFNIMDGSNQVFARSKRHAIIIDN